LLFLGGYLVKSPDKHGDLTECANHGRIEVSGVRCQVSEMIDLNTEILVIVIWDFGMGISDCGFRRA